MALTEYPLKRGEDGNTDESSATSKSGSGMTEKLSRWRDLKEYLTSKEGWVGNYVCSQIAQAQDAHAQTSLTMSHRTIFTSLHQISGP